MISRLQLVLYTSIIALDALGDAARESQELGHAGGVSLFNLVMWPCVLAMHLVQLGMYWQKQRKEKT